MESVMSSLVQRECVSSSQSLRNLDHVVSSICDDLTSRTTSLINNKDVQALADAHDGSLLQINLLMSIFQANHCKKVQELQQRLIGNSKLFESLVHYLGDHSHIIAYSACKVLVAFIIHDVARLSKLEYLIRCSLETPHYLLTNLKKSRYHQILLTFDLFRLLCKKPHLKENNICCSCGELQTNIWIDHQADMLKAMSGFVLLLQPFQVLHKERRDSHCFVHSNSEIVKLISQDLKWLLNFQPKEFDMLFLSYLKMLKSFIKGSDKDRSEPFLLTIVDFLVKFLEEGFWYTRQSLRVSVDILVIVLRSRLKYMTTEYKGLRECQIQTARSLCELVKGEWLSKLPCGTQPVGFGGVNFTETCPDQMRDLTLLRRLTKLIFVSVQLITEPNEGETVLLLTYSACSLRHLKTFIESLKLDLSSELRTDWIHQLFADEDEVMVSVLLIALQIYNQIIRPSSNKQPDITASQSQCELKQLLCPHLSFWNYLKLLDFDHSVLLDLLISSETNFLEYFTLYLHLMKREWDECCDTFRINSKENEHVSGVDSDIAIQRMEKMTGTLSNSESTSPIYTADHSSLNRANYEKFETNLGLDQVLSVLIRLRMSLERLQQKNMFPYSVSPLIRSLQELEALYEQ